VALVALPEAPTTEVAVRQIRELRPDVGIAARVHRAADHATMMAAGADATVYAEDMAGSAMLEAALRRLEASSELDVGGEPPDVAA
jgi:hypothetical protein